MKYLTAAALAWLCFSSLIVALRASNERIRWLVVPSTAAAIVFAAGVGVVLGL